MGPKGRNSPSLSLSLPLPLPAATAATPNNRSQQINYSSSPHPSPCTGAQPSISVPAMCLKYFIAHSACDHHEYLGSYYCSFRPCEIAAQHFHRLEDNFPVPWPSSLQSIIQSSKGALACDECTAGYRDLIKPDGVLPVQYYPPTDGIEVASAESERCLSCGMDSEENSSSSYNCDYKALSAADEEEWSTQEEHNQDPEPHPVHNETAGQLHSDFIRSQLKDLPQYLAQRQQSIPSMPPGFTSDTYAFGHNYHNPMAHIAELAPPYTPYSSYWHASMSSLYQVPSIPSPSCTDDSTSQVNISTTHEAAPSTIEAQHPETPLPTPPTGPRHSLPSRPTPPFIVGTVTDAYLRVEAARNRHWRERARRQAKPFFPDTLPVRSMALEDFVVDKVQKKVQPEDTGASQISEADAGSSLPLADEDKLQDDENDV